MDAPTGLRAWLDAAWSRHDREPRALLDELASRAAALPDDEEGAEAVKLARHTAIGHLADAAALRAFLGGLPGGPAALDRARGHALWVIATLEGQAAPPQADDVRWGLMQDVVAAEIELGRLPQARARVVDEESGAVTHADAAARRAYAACCNNLALALRTGLRGDAARDAFMIEVATIARRAWEKAGTWMHVERAEYQLARCHAVLGNGDEALRHAAACLERCQVEGADAAERFFAHEALAHAHRARDDDASAAAHRAQMGALLPQIEDAGLRAWCEETLAAAPR